MIFYVYFGYFLLLRLLLAVCHGRGESVLDSGSLRSVTVLVTVFNERGRIEKKIRNALACDYPNSMFQILIASDGSTDGTEEVVKNMQIANVRTFCPSESMGKTDTQNKAMLLAEGEIVIFTDVNTIFDKEFLKDILKPFSDPKVGCVDGNLVFLPNRMSGVSKAQSIYWRQELALRELESRLGILAIGSGACLAVRRALFTKMDIEYGEDCIIPLDIIMQGYKVIHASEALAFDDMEHEIGKEFRNRVRMTLRNIQGNVSRKSLLNPIRYAGYSLALWSHKMFRWFTPFLLIALFLANLILLEKSNFYTFILGGQVTFYLMSIVGFFAEKNGVRLPIFSQAFSFFLVNLGFFTGICLAMVGKKITSYNKN
jgi:cellulose synthase/poly-beta-1,6-N-acetylglucosamine synthase-like glycosyltransferase